MGLGLKTRGKGFFILKLRYTYWMEHGYVCVKDKVNDIPPLVHLNWRFCFRRGRAGKGKGERGRGTGGIYKMCFFFFFFFFTCENKDPESQYALEYPTRWINR